jgi:hypothetical protein
MCHSERVDVFSVAERVDARLARTIWDTSAIEQTEIEAAAEVATFALKLAGKRRQARRGGRFGRLIVGFALAACVALAACDKPNAAPEETQTAIDALPSAQASTAWITAKPGSSAASYFNMLLVDPGSDSRPWAVLTVSGGSTPILVDRNGAGLDTVGATYRMAAQPITVGTRDGPSQFLDPLQPATQQDNAIEPVSVEQVEQRWAQDERYLAATRAISGQTTALDAAYNAAAAAAAGGTHTYLNGVVLRVEPDNPVLEVVDRALLESGTPTRAEDVVYVAIRPSEQSLYNPGQVVNLRNVAVNKQNTDVNGQQTTVYVVNAALDGARVEPTGSVDLQSLLQPRLQRVDQDIAGQSQAAPSPTVTPAPTNAPAGQTVIVQQQPRGPSFVDDFLIWMWLSNSGWYRGPSVIINNPPPVASRPPDQTYYSPPPSTSSTNPSTVASQQAASRSTALEASRSAVSGQASGTGGGVAATNKSAANASTQVGAATAKSAAVAGQVSASSVGKSVSSVPSSGSSTASRSAGDTSAGTRSSAGTSSSSGKGISGASSSSAGKGVSGASSSSGSSGGFGGRGGSSSSSS